MAGITINEMQHTVCHGATITATRARDYLTYFCFHLELVSFISTNCFLLPLLRVSVALVQQTVPFLYRTTTFHGKMKPSIHPSIHLASVAAFQSTTCNKS